MKLKDLSAQLLIVFFLSVLIAFGAVTFDPLLGQLRQQDTTPSSDYFPLDSRAATNDVDMGESYNLTDVRGATFHGEPAPTDTGMIKLTPNTSDGSDTKYFKIGGYDATRGASLLLAGNETDIVAVDGGIAHLQSGSKATAYTKLESGSVSFTLNYNADITLVGMITADDNSGVAFDAAADGMADDKYNGITMAGLNAGETISQWDVVYFDQTDSEWKQADADAAGEFPARGIAVAAGTDGNELVVIVQGMIRNDDWNWTVGGSIYLSDTAGGLTQTAPSDSGDCVQLLGWATSADEMCVDVTGSWLEVE